MSLKDLQNYGNRSVRKYKEINKRRTSRTSGCRTPFAVFNQVHNQICIKQSVLALHQQECKKSNPKTFLIDKKAPSVSGGRLIFSKQI
jgi:hypothetical protein